MRTTKLRSAAAPLLLVFICTAVQAASRPNILFIYTDDQAPRTIRAAGHPQIHTPHLDRLCRQGMRFTNAFVTTPVCSPARATLMTGRYASELAIYDWISPRRDKQLGLVANVPTWPQLLTKAGYDTGLIGKWHLGTADRYHPTRRGYGYFMGFRAGGMHPKDPLLEVAGQPKRFSGLTIDLLTDDAIRFIKSHQGEGKKPFALSVHYRAPHAPWLPVRDEDWAPYKDLDPQLPDPNFPDLRVKRVKRMTREYLASITSVDRNVGRLMKSLQAAQLVQSTVVIFTSDHGYHAGHGGLWYKGNAQWQLKKFPRRQWKHIAAKQRPNLFDQALRVPLVVRWPKTVKPGSLNHRTVTNLDWFKTLLEIAGVELPTKPIIRGRSFVPLLQSKPVKWNDEMFAEYSMRHGAKTKMQGIRTPKWKYLVDWLHPGRIEFYDLTRDPRERKNLAASTTAAHQAIRLDLHAQVIKHFRQIGQKK